MLAEASAQLLRGFFAERRRRRTAASTPAAWCAPELGRHNLRTARLVLEPIVGLHADALWPLFADPAMIRPGRDVVPPSAPWLAAHFGQLERRLAPDGSSACLRWAIRELAGGDYVGWAEAIAHADGTASIDAAITPSRRRLGLAAEALAAVIGQLGEHAAVHVVGALARPADDAAVSLLRALGFREAAPSECPQVHPAPGERVFARRLGPTRPD